MQFLGQRMDLPSDFGVQMQLRVLGMKVMVRFGLLESRLAVLADHHEGRQEDRLQRHHQGQRRPGTFFQHKHPHREQHRMNPDELHRPRERGDPVGDAQLKILVPFPGLLQHGGVMPLGPLKQLARYQLWFMPAELMARTSHCTHFLSAAVAAG